MKHLVFKRGLRDGIPIGLGYFVVSIGIGIACRTAKLGAAQGFFMSLLNNASAGEYGGITVIAGGDITVEAIDLSKLAIRALGANIGRQSAENCR